MPTEQQIPSDHPLMRAWEDYKKMPDYANALQWALQPEHTQGALWGAFSRGYMHGTMHYEQLRQESLQGAIATVKLIEKLLDPQTSLAATRAAVELVKHFKEAGHL